MIATLTKLGESLPTDPGIIRRLRAIRSIWLGFVRDSSIMPTGKINQADVVLAAMAAKNGSVFAPVQVQKMFFLLDRNIADRCGGPWFDFEPYDYGPFDKEVYRALERWAVAGMVRIDSGASSSRRTYALTPAGQAKGEAILKGLPNEAQAFMERVSDWVRSMSFAQLVGAIYRAYPDMRENSIFQDS